MEAEGREIEMQHRNIMIVGTASGVGKSTVTTALARIFVKDGYKVSPFKSQNMALSSYVTKDGKEMGIGQAVQAEAIGIEAEAWMNPILLKPSQETLGGKRAIDVFYLGEFFEKVEGKDYHREKKKFIPLLEKLYDKIRKNYDICVIEGAGSPAEINMEEEDISNFGMARIADAPVILVADIDRGGVFASIYGTIMLLSEEDRKRVRGIIINKFRGDAKVLDLGFQKIEALTGVPTLGVLPYLDFDIEEEDNISERHRKHLPERKKGQSETAYREEQYALLEKILRENCDIERIYEMMKRG